MRVKSAARRARIVEAAWEVFSAQGLKGASVEEIAARAQCSKPTIYTYFKSKNELFIYTIEHTVTAPAKEPFAVLAEGGPLRDRLLAFARMHVAVRLSDRMVAVDRIIIEAAKCIDVYNLVRERNRAMRARLAESLHAEMDHGALVPSDPLRAAIHLLALIEQDLRERRLYGDAGITASMVDEQVEQGVAAFLRAYEAS